MPLVCGVIHLRSRIVSSIFFLSALNVPISVPTPRRLPPKAIRALSPPELPPDVNLRFRGFTVRPNVLLTDSAIIIAVGTFVLTYSTAPALLSMSTRTVLYVAGWLTHETKPTVESLPIILKLSLREMGKPWSGPIGFPVFARCSSSALAASRASGKSVSERQLVLLNNQHWHGITNLWNQYNTS